MGVQEGTIADRYGSMDVKIYRNYTPSKALDLLKNKRHLRGLFDYESGNYYLFDAAEVEHSSMTEALNIEKAQRGFWDLDYQYTYTDKTRSEITESFEAAVKEWAKGKPAASMTDEEAENGKEWGVYNSANFN